MSNRKWLLRKTIKKSFLFAALSIASLACSGGDDRLLFRVGDQTKEIKSSSVERLNPVERPVDDIGARFIELASLNLSEYDYLKVGTLRDKPTETGQTGLWQVRGGKYFLLYSAFDGRFFTVGEKSFVYINRYIGAHEKNGIVFEVNKGGVDGAVLQEVYFVVGRILDITSSGSSILITSFSSNISNYRLSKLSYSNNGCWNTVLDFGLYMDND